MKKNLETIESAVKNIKELERLGVEKTHPLYMEQIGKLTKESEELGLRYEELEMEQVAELIPPLEDLVKNDQVSKHQENQMNKINKLINHDYSKKEEDKETNLCTNRANCTECTCEEVCEGDTQEQESEEENEESSNKLTYEEIVRSALRVRKELDKMAGENPVAGMLFSKTQVKSSNPIGVSSLIEVIEDTLKGGEGKELHVVINGNSEKCHFNRYKGGFTAVIGGTRFTVLPNTGRIQIAKLDLP